MAEQGARTLQTTDRLTTDGRATAYSEREHEFTFAKNNYARLGLRVLFLGDLYK